MSPFPPDDFDCQSCGACCATSADWPRFSTEDDAALALIPDAMVAADLSGMRCEDGRCAALTGAVGTHTACAIHPLRPEVCRACMPGDPECVIARDRWSLFVPEAWRASAYEVAPGGGASAPS